MGDVRESITVAAPPGHVWDSTVDYESRPRWAPRVKKATIVDGGPLREGSRIRLHIGRDRFTARVVEFQPPRRLSLLVKGPGFRVNHVYELTPNQEATELVLTGRFRGVVGSLVARFMRGTVQRDLTDELAAIKAAAEEHTPG